MQQLHLVGLTTDLDGLIFSTRRNARSGGFVVALDEELLATIADVLRKREGDNPRHAATAHLIAQAAGIERRPQSALSLREIQARLRAGRTVEEVAAEAGVEPDWVERFAVPIRAEQQQVVAQAGGMVYTRPRVGPSSQPLAVAVRWNLAERGVRMTAGELARAWQAWQVHDSVWVVRLAYRSRGRPQVAEWELDVRAGTLTARNRLASQLAYVEPRRRPPVLDDVDEDAVAAAAVAGTARATAPAAAARSAGGAATKRAAAKKAAKKTAAKKTAKRAAKKTAKKRAAGVAAAKKVAQRSAAAKKVAARKTAAAKKTRKTAGAAATIVAGTVGGPAASRRRAAGGTAARSVTRSAGRGASPAPIRAGRGATSRTRTTRSTASPGASGAGATTTGAGTRRTATRAAGHSPAERDGQAGTTTPPVGSNGRGTAAGERGLQAPAGGAAPTRRPRPLRAR